MALPACLATINSLKEGKTVRSRKRLGEVKTEPIGWNKQKYTTCRIPLEVTRDTTLSAMARLIFLEIVVLSNNKRKYCWASNAYLGKLVGLYPDNVSRYISELKENGYIQTKLIPNFKRYDNGKPKTERRTSISLKAKIWH